MASKTPGMVDLKCGHCGKEFTRKRSGASPNPFCSQRCYWDSDFRSEMARATNERRYAGHSSQVPCVQCGKLHKRNNSRTTVKRFYCSRDCQHAFLRSQGKDQLTNGGYIKVYVGMDYPGATKTGHILQHRKVMQDILGRALTDEENVHHINGVKTDNAPENLELWSRSQPAGQRVEDKVAWARAILEQYGDLYPTAKTEL